MLKKVVLSCFVICLVCSTMSFGQELSEDQVKDEQLIKQTIDMYFDGWMTGDTTKVGQAMHSTCHLKYIRDGEVVDISRNEYLSKFKPHPKSEDTEGRIIDLNITRTAASAKCEIERPNRLFTDYFNLLKVGERWYIVDKISTSISKE